MVEAIPLVNPNVARIRAAIKNAADVQPVMEIKQLVKGWLSEGALSVLYGPSNAGKTFVALSLAAHVAAGKDWWGCKVKQGKVLYLALEGGIGFNNRVAAIKQQVSEVVETRGLTIVPMSLDLYSEAGVRDLCDALLDAEYDLIVVDTLARAIAGANENTAQAMGQFVSNLDWLREATGAHVMVIHHSGKDDTKGARGSSALRAAVDTELSLTAEGELVSQKQRDLKKPESMYFDLLSIYFGMDADGDEISSAVAVATDAPSLSVKPLTGRQEVAMQALSEALLQHGESRFGENFPTNRKYVAISHWREQCQRKGITDRDATTDAQRKAFARAKDSLMQANHIRIQDDFVWRVSDE